MEVTQDMRNLVTSLSHYGGGYLGDSSAFQLLQELMAEPESIIEPSDYSQLVTAEPRCYDEGVKPKVLWQKNIRTHKWESQTYVGRNWWELRNPRLYNPGKEGK